ncbi:MAG: DUF1127 domain-containing protein [Burkholderiales bacterium]
MDTPTPLPLAAAPVVPAGAIRIFRGFRAAVRRFLARWRRGRHAARMRAELRAVDPRTLRDLGFVRSEIDSVVAEISGNAACTRVVSQHARRHPSR